MSALSPKADIGRARSITSSAARLKRSLNPPIEPPFLLDFSGRQNRELGARIFLTLLPTLMQLSGSAPRTVVTPPIWRTLLLVRLSFGFQYTQLDLCPNKRQQTKNSR